jgi:hypothetical protein
MLFNRVVLLRRKADSTYLVSITTANGHATSVSEAMISRLNGSHKCHEEGKAADSDVEDMHLGGMNAEREDLLSKGEPGASVSLKLCDVVVLQCSESKNKIKKTLAGRKIYD